MEQSASPRDYLVSQPSRRKEHLALRLAGPQLDQVGQLLEDDLPSEEHGCTLGFTPVDTQKAVDQERARRDQLPCAKGRHSSTRRACY